MNEMRKRRKRKSITFWQIPGLLGGKCMRPKEKNWENKLRKQKLNKNLRFNSIVVVLWTEKFRRHLARFPRNSADSALKSISCPRSWKLLTFPSMIFGFDCYWCRLSRQFHRLHRPWSSSRLRNLKGLSLEDFLVGERKRRKWKKILRWNWFPIC
jgi:hypothetical protein